jgi:hypothetical protein
VGKVAKIISISLPDKLYQRFESFRLKNPNTSISKLFQGFLTSFLDVEDESAHPELVQLDKDIISLQSRREKILNVNKDALVAKNEEEKNQKREKILSEAGATKRSPAQLRAWADGRQKEIVEVFDSTDQFLGECKRKGLTGGDG